MVVKYLFSALFLGFIVAIPPGSVTIVATRRAIQFGFKNSVLFSLGSIISDSFYIILVYIGVAQWISQNDVLKTFLWFFCGILLLFIGLSSIFSITRKGIDCGDPKPMVSSSLTTILSGILVTLTNPMTIVGWIAIAGNFFLIWNDKIPQNNGFGIIVIPLIIVGVLLWFLPLLFAISRLRKLLGEKIKKVLILISNGILIFFGLVAFYYAIKLLLLRFDNLLG